MDPFDDGGLHDDVTGHLEDIMLEHTEESVFPLKKVTGRGPSRPVNSSRPMFLEFDEYDLPTGVWADKYGKQIGQCALRIDINAPKWNKVDQSIKDRMWAETQKLFHIDDPTGKRKSNFERALGVRCRNFRTKLKARFIERRKAPKEGNPNANKHAWEVYAGIISEEQWKEFEARVASAEFQRRSEIGKACTAGNKHRHTLGQKSYSQKIVEWESEGLLPKPSESSSTAQSSVMSPAIQNRALVWCLAHQSKTKDGKREAKNPETAEVVSKVMDHLQKESEDTSTASVASTPDNDALVKALGKKDYGGYVKTLGRSGVGVGHRAAYGTGARRGTYDASQEKIQSLEQTVELLKGQIQHLYSTISSQGRAVPPNTDDVEVASLHRTPRKGKAPEQGPCKCRLAISDEDGNLVVVADGTYHPTSTGVIHGRNMSCDYSRVTIDMPYDEHADVNLPVPTDDGVTRLGDAKQYFVSWPTSMLIFEEQGGRPHTLISKEGKGSCDPYQPIPLAFPVDSAFNVEDEPGSLPPYCDLLQDDITDGVFDTVTVPFRAPLLYEEEDKDVWVTDDDVKEFLALDCIGAPVILVYIRYLVDTFPTVFNSGLVTFLCPQRVSAVECNRSKKDVYAYLRKAFFIEAARNESYAPLILAPYNENNHWILLAIDLQRGLTLVFDSLMPTPPRRCVIYPIIKRAYLAYRSKVQGNDINFACNPMTCAKQPGSTECGYYVMKYMHEIVSGIASGLGNDNMFTSRTTAFTELEVNETREQWAKYFKNNFLMS